MRPSFDLPVENNPANPWIEANDIMDSVALLLNGFAKRCSVCKRPIRIKYLKDGKCPDHV